MKKKVKSSVRFGLFRLFRFLDTSVWFRWFSFGFGLTIRLLLTPTKIPSNVIKIYYTADTYILRLYDMSATLIGDQNTIAKLTNNQDPVVTRNS